VQQYLSSAWISCVHLPGILCCSNGVEVFFMPLNIMTVRDCLIWLWWVITCLALVHVLDSFKLILPFILGCYWTSLWIWRACWDIGKYCPWLNSVCKIPTFNCHSVSFSFSALCFNSVHIHFCLWETMPLKEPQEVCNVFCINLI